MRVIDLLRATSLAALTPVAGGQAPSPLVPSESKLLPTQVSPVALFGTSVAIVGDTIVVGAPWDSHEAAQAGSVWVYRFAGAAWEVEARLVGDDTASGDHFGREVDVDGDTLIVTAWRADAPAHDSGAAYVFRRVGATWTQEAKLVGSDAAETDLFGSGVALDGDTAVVGSWWHDTGGLEHAGKVYVFERSGTQWAEVQRLTADDSERDDGFGLAVDVERDRLVVGAWLEDGQANGGGAVYVFERDPLSGAWTQAQKLHASNGTAFDRFGRSVDLHGDTLIVGRQDSNEPGSAYVFAHGPGGWSEEAELLPGDGVPGDEFGVSVAVHGDVAVVGAGWRNAAVPATGAAYRFVRSAGTWTRQARLMSTDAEVEDHLGIAVRTDGERVVVGANWSDDLGSQSGSAYVFRAQPGPGSNYCVSAPNTSGDAAWISATGSASIAANDLTLHAFRLPAGQFAILAYGGAPARYSLGHGTLCIAPFAPGVFRVLPILQASADGVASMAMDFGAPPPGGAIQGGDTWYFQFWYRDPSAGGSGFNLSDGLELVFLP